jgi:hypothetical protein
VSWGYVPEDKKIIWVPKESEGIEIYKDGSLVGIIPHRNLPLLISDAALLIDYHRQRQD